VTYKLPETALLGVAVFRIPLAAVIDKKPFAGVGSFFSALLGLSFTLTLTLTNIFWFVEQGFEIWKRAFQFRNEEEYPTRK